jgi:hypothetical protein
MAERLAFGSLLNLRPEFSRKSMRSSICSRVSASSVARFETLIDEFKIDDPAITLLAKVVHGADVSEDRDATPESRGLLAIADGFALLGVDDQRQLELELPVYDALYAWAQQQVKSA